MQSLDASLSGDNNNVGLKIVQPANTTTPEDKGDSKLKYGAWMIEILASSAGFAVALTQYEKGGIIGFVKSGSVIFIIIALLELVKIPLLNTIYKTRSVIWRGFFTIMFLLSVVVTFETFSVSFYMNYAQQVLNTTAPYKEGTISLEQAYTKIDYINDQVLNKAQDIQVQRTIIDELQQKRELEIDNQQRDLAPIDKQLHTIEVKYQNKRQQVVDTYTKQRNTAQKLRDSKTNTLQGMEQKYYQDKNTLTQQYNTQIDTLKKQQGNIALQKQQQYQNKLTQKQQEREQLKDTFNNDKNTLNKTYAAKITKAEKAVESANFFNKDSRKIALVTLTQEKDSKQTALQQRYDQDMHNIDSEITQLENAINKIRDNNSDIWLGNSDVQKIEQIKQTQISKLDSEYTAKVQALKIEIADLDTYVQGLGQKQQTDLTKVKMQPTDKLQQQRTGVLGEYKSKLQQVDNKMDNVRDKNKQIQQTITALRAEKTALQNKVAEMGYQLQIYTISRSVYKWIDSTKKNAYFVPREHMDKIASIWFMTLSIVAAILGSVLYLAYLVSRYAPKRNLTRWR